MRDGKLVALSQPCFEIKPLHGAGIGEQNIEHDRQARLTFSARLYAYRLGPVKVSSATEYRQDRGITYTFEIVDTDRRVPSFGKGVAYHCISK